MTWLEVLPVGFIMSIGVFIMGYGLDAAHRGFHYGLKHRYAQDVVDYKIDARDEEILHFRDIQNKPKKLHDFINEQLK
ncbi:hypothetical protein DLAC_06988 [Tieghemostelium lacteum]|uniref:Uncharacterized protein n=1 Tax=Tieghemostelium lacteum TaxID=361077 RepID=A0A151ZDY9_TIELA|nr:hypothetical protein DLAC_06988 [Tieghemostelium lacteum]|eukprot:KYQ92145.1 hypothetical protein DLAC_06988 [Tieghemostelium lacteum]